VNLGFTPHRESAAERTEITLITRHQCRRLLEVIPNSEHLWHKFDVEADKVQLTYSKDQLNQLDRKYDKTTDPQGATKELGAILVRCIYGYLMAADVLLSQGLRELVDMMMDDLRPVESGVPGLPTYKALLKSSARISVGSLFPLRDLGNLAVTSQTGFRVAISGIHRKILRAVRWNMELVRPYLAMGLRIFDDVTRNTIFEGTLTPLRPTRTPTEDTMSTELTTQAEWAAKILVGQSSATRVQGPTVSLSSLD
jgi:hypothetical protein